MSSKPKRERNSDHKDIDLTTVESSTPATSLLDHDFSRNNVKREKVILSMADADNLYFIETNTDMDIQTRVVHDRYMPSKTQEKDMLCIRSNNRDGKLVLLQIWDNSQGVHVQYFHKLMSQALQTPESESNGGATWKIISEPPDNAKSNNKSKLVPRFTETKDKYWINMYGDQYCKTLTLVGFDRTSSTITLPKKVLPQLVEWDSRVQYEVDGKILPQPREWANLSTGGDEDRTAGDGDNDNSNEFASLADIDTQVSNPCALNSSPSSTNSLFDTPTRSSVSSSILLPTSTTTTSGNSKKGRYM